MTFKTTHYKVTPDQPLGKIEAYLKSIGAFPDTEQNDIMEQRGDVLYVILYNDGEYTFHNHDGGYSESFVPTAVNVKELGYWQDLHNMVYATCGRYKLTCNLTGQYKIILDNAEIFRTRNTFEAVKKYNYLINQEDENNPTK
jgi:hypothetical protein